jgi:hypothetical protein
MRPGNMENRSDDRDPLAGLSLADLPTKKRERIL